jgi:hypothetical protein
MTSQALRRPHWGVTGTALVWGPAIRALAVCMVPRLRELHVRKPQYDFGRPSTFSAMKHRMSCGLTGASRGIMASRKKRSMWYSLA